MRKSVDMHQQWTRYAQTTEAIIDLLSNRAESADEAALHLGVALGILSTIDEADIDEAIRVAQEIRDGYRAERVKRLS